MARIAINGLGRIGRAVLKILLDTPGLELVAVNDLEPLDNLIYLLRYDTVYGRYNRSIEAAGSMLAMGDRLYPFLSEEDPIQLPWRDLNVDIVLECTGAFKARGELEKHLQAGAKRVILSTPSRSNGIETVVPGVNEAADDCSLISTASCTTNCITPIVEIMDRRIGIKKAAMTTVHAYTSSQAIVDAPNKNYRRGRAAAANFVPTTTEAAIATPQVLPELSGRFNGVAIRGPVPAGSMADITFVAERYTSVDEIEAIFQHEANTDRYRDILGVTQEALVSSDIVQDPRASIVDLTMTQVIDGDLVKVMAWYDNEWGYANQMIRETLRMARRLPANPD